LATSSERETERASTSWHNTTKVGARSFFEGLTSLFSAFSHPYEYEINNLVYAFSRVTLHFKWTDYDHRSYLDNQMAAVQERLYGPIEATAATWVDTPEALADLAAQLEQEPEFAIDLEAHSYRTFQGFCCLMQISTRTLDFLVDVLPLRGHMSILNAVFTNPRIVKVLHGADSDVVWLQRDFGLYVVNMFDTGQASRVLGTDLLTSSGCCPVSNALSRDAQFWSGALVAALLRCGCR
jgi:hypothetical protein